MSRTRKQKDEKGRITVSGNIPRPGQRQPAVVRITQPKRFNVDTADFMTAIKAAENVDYSQRAKLYDLYTDILLDAHLSCVIDKRKNAVLCSDIEFRRDGKPDDSINEQIRSPWFNRCISDILDARFWGCTLLQFFRSEQWIDYDLIPRKHVDPVRKLILRYQTDIQGTTWDEYGDLLFVGDRMDLGLLAKAAPWIIYKRNATADWAQFSEVFGMPIQEYIYETDDDEARARALIDANSIGSLATFIHGKDTELQLREAGNKTGSADVYVRLIERCNNEISKLILGNTLTTESSEKGTQALGTVHKKVEDKVAQSDRLYVLDVLNYDMTDIFTAMGIDTEGGKFCFPEQKDVDLASKMSILTQLCTNFSLPVDDDYLYEEFGIEKPKDYEQQKQRQIEERAQREQERLQAQQQATESPTPGGGQQEPSQKKDDKKDEEKENKKLKNILRSFFVKAPRKGGAPLDW